jgi:hypothetical protein
MSEYFGSASRGNSIPRTIERTSWLKIGHWHCSQPIISAHANPLHLKRREIPPHPK